MREHKLYRYELINYLIKKHGYKKYLEIGTQWGNCFRHIDIDYKICVDPVKRYDSLTYEMTSDDYFAKYNETFDIIFVDGLHLEYQSTLDIKNALKILNSGGTIVAHDCLPESEERTDVCHNGTVYRSIIDLRYNNPNVNVHVVDSDCGCAVIKQKPQSLYDKVPIELAKTFFYYHNYKQELMNIISVEEFKQKLESGEI
jgi:hypothetical protein